MKLIVGLGNPGRKYQGTRHNVGFDVLSKLAGLLAAPGAKTKFEGEMTEGHSGGQKLVLLWPHTYMNASGRSVRKAKDFFKLDDADLLVVCDDLNLPTGRLRIRPRGSAGGQKGLADIIRMLGGEEFARLRVGIDRPPPGWQTPDYVLGRFDSQEQSLIDPAIDRAARAVMDWAVDDMTAVMSRYNAKAD
ncbi:aminoacyl-tRNA hydrolase [Crateriforma conspicua]|uniref:Peptidyl-tRNA hydrolase n=1 Tax=Crateriforma conspicua TaxID=2527996 RepID=A0A5C5Y719_9PLAN|nr:aminoacyl-tRNA hydrolase [Crateriforma conspicua]QDV64688.1 Peptidyl-tRNA hydrolase [Crateriforma conspicua]TWT70085.1 Peptidyl-tRNA hydrolase [Crateriforma conspicua]